MAPICGMWLREKALGFFEQTLAIGVVVAGSRRHALDRDESLESGIFRTVDLPHAAGTETARDYESTDRGAGQRIRDRVRLSCRWGRLYQIIH